jgi:tetratricopeptide (TPR) repeat protein
MPPEAASPRLSRTVVIALGAGALLAALLVAGYFHRENRRVEAELAIERAVAAAGRGETTPAIATLEALAQTGPVRGRALFERARIAQHLGDYNGAREGYLAALAIDPHHADARMSLVELTAGAGAIEEARHHLGELEKLVAASDPRVSRSRALLAAR